MHDPFDASTIIFGLLAVFIIWKLRSVLGTRNGVDDGPKSPGPRSWGRFGSGTFGAPAQPVSGPVEAPPTSAPYTDDVRRGLDAIRNADRTFDLASFIEGARTAYTMIVSAFSKGDQATLDRLLSDDALRAFRSALADRDPASAKLAAQVVSIDSVDVTGASLVGSVANVVLRFKAKIVESGGGDAKSGSAPAEGTIEANDLWTFSRDTRNSDPNWLLIATSAEDGHVI